MACYKNGNNNIRVVAVAVVSGENGSNWTWFLELVKGRLNFEPSYIISDRDKGLQLACHTVYPTVHHFYCFRHVMENFNRKFGNKALKVVAWRLVKAPTQFESMEQQEKLKSMSEPALNWLMNIGFDKITLVYSPVCRYGMVTSNNVESINSRFKDYRRLPILEFLLSIEKTILVDMVDDRTMVASWSTSLTGYAAKVYAENIRKSSVAATIIRTGVREYIVLVAGKQFQVSIGPHRFRCSCGSFCLVRFPCMHYTAVLLQLQDETMEGHHCPTWSKDLFSSACLPFDVEYPLTILDDLIKSETYAPSITKTRGRPKKNRFESQGSTVELERQIRTSTRGPYKCKKCNERGHNARTCTVNLPPGS